MTTTHTFRILAASAALILGIAGAQAQMQRQATQVGGLKAPTKLERVTPVPCNSVSACNQIIAYCAANNGTWIEGASNGQGQPSRGTCYLP